MAYFSNPTELHIAKNSLRLMVLSKGERGSILMSFITFVTPKILSTAAFSSARARLRTYRLSARRYLKAIPDDQLDMGR